MSWFNGLEGGRPNLPSLLYPPWVSWFNARHRPGCLYDSCLKERTYFQLPYAGVCMRAQTQQATETAFCGARVQFNIEHFFFNIPPVFQAWSWQLATPEIDSVQCGLHLFFLRRWSALLQADLTLITEMMKTGCLTVEPIFHACQDSAQAGFPSVTFLRRYNLKSFQFSQGNEMRNARVIDSLLCIGEGNGNPLQCSCLENPRDGGAWGGFRL